MNKTFLSSHLSVRSVDAAAGTAIFRINTPALDSDNECVLPRGCDTSQFNRNSPLLDSHQYDSVQHLLGTVTSLDISDDYIDATVKFATDVEENTLAKLAFGMVKAGYLKACSVGFVPIASLRPSDGKRYNEAVKALDLPPGARPVKIHTQWALKELSICVMGANPEALVRSQKAAGLSDSDLATLATKTQIRSTKNMSSRTAFLDRLSGIVGLSNRSNLETENALKEFESARRSPSETGHFAAVRQLFLAERNERQKRAIAYIAALFEDEETKLAMCGSVKRLVKMYCQPDEGAAVDSLNERALKMPGAEKAVKAMSEAGDIGLGLGATQLVSQVVIDLVAIFGVAYDTLGVRPINSGSGKFVRVTGYPAAIWFTQGRQPSAMTPDVAFAGQALSDTSNMLGTLIEVSAELVEDSKLNGDGADITSLILTRSAEGLAAGLDTAAFSGDGVDDIANGAQYGIFNVAAVPQVNAAAGNTTVASLQAADFLNTAAAVNPAALQRGGRFWVNPTFLPALMQLKDGAIYLVQSPLQNESGEWSLCRFPMSLTTAAPLAVGAGEPVCAFGYGPAYNIGVRQTIEFSYGQPKFNQNIRSIRVAMRARCEMNDASWFAILNFAAE